MAPWDDTKKYKLLLTIITVLDVKPPNWDTVAQKMGGGLTAEAVRQQYNKIKKAAAAELGSGGGGAAAATTPRRRNGTASNGTASNAGTPSKSTGKRGKAAKNYAEDDDDDDEEDSRLVSPSKRQKMEDDAFDGDIAKVKMENGDAEEE